MGKGNSRPTVDCSGDPVRTKQQFKDECDINRTLARFAAQGIDVRQLMGFEAVYADVSGLGDYREVVERVRSAEDAFARLPSRVRERFGNDAAELLEFLGDPENRKEAEELGLLTPAIAGPDQGAAGGGPRAPQGGAAGAVSTPSEGSGSPGAVPPVEPPKGAR